MKNGLFPVSPDHKVPLTLCSAEPEVMQRASRQENLWHYPNPPRSNQIKMVVSRGRFHRRRAGNSATPPNKSSKLSFVIKCQLDSTSGVFLTHCDDNRSFRDFSGQFVCLFLTCSTLSHTESFVLLG